MKGSKAVLTLLERQGVDVMFGYPGAQTIPIYDDLIDSSIHHVLVRHEQGAAHMADGYARATGGRESAWPPPDRELRTWSPGWRPPMPIHRR